MTLACGVTLDRAVDGAVVRAAVAIGRRTGEAVRLVHVAADAAAGLRARTAAIHGLPVEVVVGAGAEAIERWLEAHSIRMVLVGAQAGERLLGVASSPVVIVRDAAPFEAWADGRAPLEVLLAIAPGRSCEAAAGLLPWLLGAGGCSLTALHSFGAFEARWRYGIAPSAPESAVTALLERDLRAWLEDHELAGARLWLAGATEQAGHHVARLAQASGAGLVVAGLGAFSHGSVPHHLVAETGLSVALVPERAATAAIKPRHIRLVLVPTDFRADGWSALAEAYAAVERGGRVHVVHLHAGQTVDPGFEERMRAWTSHVAWDAATGVTLTWSSEPGTSIATGIAQAAERLGADLVCLATRARPGLRGLWAGSVARELVGRLHRPLLVCPVE